MCGPIAAFCRKPGCALECGTYRKGSAAASSGGRRSAAVMSNVSTSGGGPLRHPVVDLDVAGELVSLCYEMPEENWHPVGELEVFDPSAAAIGACLQSMYRDGAIEVALFVDVGAGAAL